MVIFANIYTLLNNYGSLKSSLLVNRSYLPFSTSKPIQLSKYHEINKNYILHVLKNKETFKQAKTFFTDPTPSGSYILPCRGIPQQKPCGISPVQISQTSTSGRCEEDELTGSVQSFLRSYLKLVRNEKAIVEL